MHIFFAQVLMLEADIAALNRDPEAGGVPQDESAVADVVKATLRNVYLRAAASEDSSEAEVSVGSGDTQEHRAERPCEPEAKLAPLFPTDAYMASRGDSCMRWSKESAGARRWSLSTVASSD